MENFTPISALIGGAMIGAAAVLFMALNGRIAGISGIVGGLLKPHAGDVAWRLAFTAGLIVAPVAYALSGSVAVNIIPTDTPTMAVGGLLVGFGATLGGGCTSGHGVCGVARLSRRSVIATATFMATGFMTVLVVRHLVGG